MSEPDPTNPYEPPSVSDIAPAQSPGLLATLGVIIASLVFGVSVFLGTCYGFGIASIYFGDVPFVGIPFVIFSLCSPVIAIVAAGWLSRRLKPSVQHRSAAIKNPENDSAI